MTCGRSRDLDVGGGGSSREANGVVEGNLVTSGLDDQGRQARQVGEYRTDQAKCGVLALRVVGDSGLEEFPAEQRVDVALGFHRRPGEGEINIRGHHERRGWQSPPVIAGVDQGGRWRGPRRQEAPAKAMSEGPMPLPRRAS
jgi:hypothetical protein